MGVNGIVAFIGESRGEGDGLDTLKGALHSSLDRSSIKLCCCLWVKNQDLFVTLVNVYVYMAISCLTSSVVVGRVAMFEIISLQQLLY